jgi:hypothetical protein
MQRVMIQADRDLLERARQMAHMRGVSFPQFVREALVRELALTTTEPKAISCAGIVSTRGEARTRGYRPDTWR